MFLFHEHVGSKILAEIKIYILTRAELLCPLCYEDTLYHMESSDRGQPNILVPLTKDDL